MLGKFNCICIDQSSQCMKTFLWYLENMHGIHDMIGFIILPPITLGDQIKSRTDEKSRRRALMRCREYTRICDVYRLIYKTFLQEDCGQQSIEDFVRQIARENNAHLILMPRGGLSVLNYEI